MFEPDYSPHMRNALIPALRKITTVCRAYRDVRLCDEFHLWNTVSRTVDYQYAACKPRLH